MDDDILFHKRCAFGGKYVSGRLDLLILRGSINDNVIQVVVEEFFDRMFQIESSTTVVQKEKEIKDFQVVGWAGGSSVLKVVVDAKGRSTLLDALEKEWSQLAYTLARKLDLSMPFNPERVLRFVF